MSTPTVQTPNNNNNNVVTIKKIQAILHDGGEQSAIAIFITKGAETKRFVVSRHTPLKGLLRQFDCNDNTLFVFQGEALDDTLTLTQLGFHMEGAILDTRNKSKTNHAKPTNQPSLTKAVCEYNNGCDVILTRREMKIFVTLVPSGGTDAADTGATSPRFIDRVRAALTSSAPQQTEAPREFERELRREVKSYPFWLAYIPHENDFHLTGAANLVATPVPADYEKEKVQALRNLPPNANVARLLGVVTAADDDGSSTRRTHLLRFRFPVSLAEVLADGSLLREAKVVDALCACPRRLKDGVLHLHRNNLFHGALKPSNAMLIIAAKAKQGACVLVDFFLTPHCPSRGVDPETADLWDLCLVCIEIAEKLGDNGIVASFAEKYAPTAGENPLDYVVEFIGKRFGTRGPSNAKKARPHFRFLQAVEAAFLSDDVDVEDGDEDDEGGVEDGAEKEEQEQQNDAHHGAQDGDEDDESAAPSRRGKKAPRGKKESGKRRQRD